MVQELSKQALSIHLSTGAEVAGLQQNRNDKVWCLDVASRLAAALTSDHKRCPNCRMYGRQPIRRSGLVLH
jgi:hypothetical protein